MNNTKIKQIAFFLLHTLDVRKKQRKPSHDLNNNETHGCIANFQ